MISKEVLYDLYFKQGKNQYEIVDMFGINQNKVSYLFKKYGFKARNSWTEDDVTYLERYFGMKSVQAIAKHLNKTPKAIITKSKRIGLSGINTLSEEITARELARAIGADGKTIVRWINAKGLKGYKKKLSLNRSYWRINLIEFWNWAEKNSDLIKWNRFEINALGKEPEWVNEVRKSDAKKPKKSDYKYTKHDDEILTMYWNFGKEIDEIAQILNRSKMSVVRRAARLNLKRKKICIPWKPIEDEMLMDMKIKGFTDEDISIELGRSYGSVAWRRKKLIKDGKLKWKFREEKTPTKVNLSSMNLNKNSVSL